MGKWFNTAKVLNKSLIVNPPADAAKYKKKVISVSDTFNANQEGYPVPVEHGWIYDIPSPIRKAYKSMNKYQKTLFWLTLFGMGAYATNYMTNGGLEKGAKWAKDKIEKSYSKSSSKAVESSPILAIANETMAQLPQPTATPAPDFLMYGHIKIIGDEQFQKDVVMTLEFAKRYSPADSELKNTKEIEIAYNAERMAAADGYTSVNKNFLHGRIERKEIRGAVNELNHENYHNYASLNDPKNNTEKLAVDAGGKSGDNLSYVNQSEINRFYQEFDFSQFKK